jgi:hypothetical protein
MKCTFQVMHVKVHTKMDKGLGLTLKLENQLIENKLLQHALEGAGKLFSMFYWGDERIKYALCSTKTGFFFNFQIASSTYP